MKIPKRYQEAVIRRTDNQRKKNKKKPTTVDKALHRKLKIEKQEPH